MIEGGSSFSGNSNRSKKAHIRQAQLPNSEVDFFSFRPAKMLKYEAAEITFRSLQFPPPLFKAPVRIARPGFLTANHTPRYRTDMLATLPLQYTLEEAWLRSLLFLETKNTWMEINPIIPKGGFMFWSFDLSI